MQGRGVRVQKKVSIIIPIFNAEKTLGYCINSLIEQTYQNLEVLLINDGSEDGSHSLCNAFSDNDSRIKVMTQTNAGPAAARNLGLQIASGEYIFFVDADDYVEKQYCESMVNALEDEADLVVCGYLEHSNLGDCNFTKPLRKFTVSEYSLELSKHPMDFYYGVLFNKIYKARVIRENGIGFQNKIRLGEDFLFNLEYLKHCRKVNQIDTILYHYIRYSSFSLTRTEKPIELRVSERRVLYEGYLDYWKYRNLDKKYKARIANYIIGFYLYETKRTRGLELTDKEKAEAVAYIKANTVDKYNITPLMMANFGYSEWSNRMEEEGPKRELIYFCHRGLHFLRKTLHLKKKILLYMTETKYQESLMDFRKLFLDDPHLDFYLYSQEHEQRFEDESVKVISNYKFVKYSGWDLIVCADTSLPCNLHKYLVPSLFLNQDFGTVSHDGGKGMYSYQKSCDWGRFCRFTKVLEASWTNVQMVCREEAEFGHLMEHVGSKWWEPCRMETELEVQESELGEASHIHLSENTKSNLTFEKKLKVVLLKDEKYSYLQSSSGLQYKKLKEETLFEEYDITNFIRKCLPAILGADIIIADSLRAIELTVVANKSLVMIHNPAKRNWDMSYGAKLEKSGVTWDTTKDIMEVVNRAYKSYVNDGINSEFQKDLMCTADTYENRVREVTKKLLYQKWQSRSLL